MPNKIELIPVQMKRLQKSLNPTVYQGRINPSPLSPAEHALASRMGLENIPANLFLAAITHTSCDPTNSNFHKLLAVGSASLKMFASEYFYFKFPRLPVEPLTTFTKLYLQKPTLESVSKNYGLYEKNVESDSSMVCESLLALIGALHWSRGVMAARSFVQLNFCASPVGAFPFREYRNYIVMLARHFKKLGITKDFDFRIIAESGRRTHIATFLVGVYMDDKKLGEGFGPSLIRAKDAACRNALCEIYANEVHEPSFPSNMLDGKSLFVKYPIENASLRLTEINTE